MKEIYLAIEARLHKMVPELAQIDLETGQLDAYGSAPSVAFPFASVDIRFPECEDLDATLQQCKMRVTVRVAFEAWMDESSSLTPMQWRERALDKMDITDKIYCALQGWGTDRFSDLSRTAMMPERRADGLKVCQVEFSTTLEDSAE